MLPHALHCALVLLYTLQDLNDEAVLETVDFSEFEAMFQVKRFEKGKKQMKREESENSHTDFLSHGLLTLIYRLAKTLKRTTSDRAQKG